jgi:hypothetical protein
LPVVSATSKYDELSNQVQHIDEENSNKSTGFFIIAAAEEKIIKGEPSSPF